jgi:hypothetical protein
MLDTNLPHNIEQRLRNIEAFAGIGSTDDETGAYTVELHESLVPAAPDNAPVAEPPPPPKTVAELEAELADAHAREGTE